MNNTLRRFILINKPIIFLVSKVVNLFNEKKYFKEVNRRENLSIFNYKEISNDLPYYFFDKIIGSNLYGISYVLKKFAGVDVRKDTNAYIEHGVYLGNYVSVDSKVCYANKIITFGSERRTNIKKETTKNVFTVGPYIHYASSIRGEEKTKNLKVKLGKTLLVFPSHSIANVEQKYDLDFFINKINDIKKDYDTVLCCFYFLDARNKGLVSAYENNGFKIVTAGHKYDYNFLNRLKFIIELSDDTISNSTGTHIGYCLSMKKKHWLIKQKTEFKGKDKELNIRDASQNKSLERDKELIFEVFSKNFKVQDEIKVQSIFNDFWGGNELKSKGEIKNIITGN